MTDFYANSADPADDSDLDSSVIRAEFAAIALGFTKIAGYTSAGNRVPHVNAGGTALVTTSGFSFDGTTFTAPALAVTNNAAINGSALTTTSATFAALAGATTLLTIGGTGASAVVAIPGTLEWSGTTAALTVAGGIYGAKKLKIDGAVDFGSTLAMTGKITATTAGIDVPVSALGTIYSATYTPNFYTDGSGNVASHSVSVARYIRVGNVVSVSGYIEVDPTSTGVTQFELSLPVASNLGSSSLSGTISDASYNDTGSISADAATDRAAFLFIASNAGNHGMAYQFSYTIG